MQNVLVNKAHALRPETRAAIEAELGRVLSDEEEVTIMAFSTHAEPRGRARQSAVRNLQAHLKRIDRRKRKTPAQNAEIAMREALVRARPGYRERE